MSSHKGWKKIGTYSTKQGAENAAKKQRKRGNKTKITERWGKVRTTPSGRKVIHPIDYPGGKKTKLYRVWAK